jgi:hypothetical protein
MPSVGVTRGGGCDTSFYRACLKLLQHFRTSAANGIAKAQNKRYCIAVCDRKFRNCGTNKLKPLPLIGFLRGLLHFDLFFSTHLNCTIYSEFGYTWRNMETNIVKEHELKYKIK